MRKILYVITTGDEDLIALAGDDRNERSYGDFRSFVSSKGRNTNSSSTNVPAIFSIRTIQFFNYV